MVVTHESERELPAMLGSLAGTCLPRRVIVVDSGSTDHSAEVARRTGATVIELGENVGFGRAVNAGLEASIGR